MAKNTDINAWLRGLAGFAPPTPAPVADPNAQPAVPPGNAGSGTGSPPPPAPPTMTDWIRAKAGRGLR